MTPPANVPAAVGLLAWLGLGDERLAPELAEAACLLTLDSQPADLLTLADVLLTALAEATGADRTDTLVRVGLAAAQHHNRTTERTDMARKTDTTPTPEALAELAPEPTAAPRWVGPVLTGQTDKPTPAGMLFTRGYGAWPDMLKAHGNAADPAYQRAVERARNNQRPMAAFLLAEWGQFTAVEKDYLTFVLAHGVAAEGCEDTWMPEGRGFRRLTDADVAALNSGTGAYDYLMALEAREAAEREAAARRLAAEREAAEAEHAHPRSANGWGGAA